MKIITIVGARPQFIKAAAVSRAIREKCTEILIHTGQHYDVNMSKVFFEELDIPKPDYHLKIGSGSHAKQTGEMMIEIEKILLIEKPDYVLVYGDTNSTLAGALAAAKIHIPIIHIEAGLRSFNKEMPEEINRILTDHVSTYLFCPTELSQENLKKEGICEGVYVIGDVMCDTIIYYQKRMLKIGTDAYFKRLVSVFDIEMKTQKKWYLATIHREENTDSLEKIEVILAALEQLEEIVIFPIHPRIKSYVEKLYPKNRYCNIYFTEPLGYLDMLFFINHARKVITDSGGIQKEAYIMETPCVTVRDQTEWVETLEGNCNILAKLECNDICEKVKDIVPDFDKYKKHYGNGDAAQKLKKILLCR